MLEPSELVVKRSTKHQVLKTPRSEHGHDMKPSLHNERMAAINNTMKAQIANLLTRGVRGHGRNTGRGPRLI